MDELLQMFASGGASRRGGAHFDDPLRMLKVATAGPSSMSTERRVEIMDEALHVMTTRAERVLEEFGGKDKLQTTMADVTKWRTAIRQLMQCDTAEQLEAVLAEHWDSLTLLKVIAPDGRRSGKYVRKAFKHAWMRQMFHFAQQQLAEARLTPPETADATGVTDDKTPGPVTTASTAPPAAPDCVMEETLD
jgi:hypothetical protein